MLAGTKIMEKSKFSAQNHKFVGLHNFWEFSGRSEKCIFRNPGPDLKNAFLETPGIDSPDPKNAFLGV